MRRAVHLDTGRRVALKLLHPELDGLGRMHIEVLRQRKLEEEPNVLQAFDAGEYSDEECTELERVSGMLKLESGEAPELHDWLWQRADPAGRLLTETPAKSCAGCHDSCSSRDYTCTDP